MNEQLSPFASHPHRRVQILHHYMCAMEQGDVDTISVVLQAAEQDAALERMLLEANEVYQQVDYTAVQADDLLEAQQLLRSTIAPDPEIQTEKISSLTFAKDDAAWDTPVTPIQLPESHHKSASQISESTQPATQERMRQRATSLRWYRTHPGWIAATLAASLIVLLLLPHTSALADQFLSLFRVQQFKAVHVTRQELSKHSVPTLEDLGTIQFQEHSFSVHRHLTKAQAAQMINFPILLPGLLPPGVHNNPTFSVIGSSQGTFTFSEAKTHAYLIKNGFTRVEIPTQLDGSTYQINTGAGVEAMYGPENNLSFIVMELPSPIAQATGHASLQELRNFVLSLPNVPPQLAAQLKQIDIHSGTVPLPIPSGIDAQSITMHGAAGLLLTSTTKKLVSSSMVVWQMNGIIYAVGSAIPDTKQLLAAANSLR